MIYITVVILGMWLFMACVNKMEMNDPWKKAFLFGAFDTVFGLLAASALIWLLLALSKVLS